MIGISSELWKGWMDLLYPNICAGCSAMLPDRNIPICLSCLHQLPYTQFHLHENNPAEKVFWGRIPVQAAASYLYFTKHSLVQQLLHQLKYGNNTAVGQFLGEKMGQDFSQSPRFQQVEALVPLPLFASRERKRGYNQATVIANGFSAATGIPVYENIIRRNSATSTQTHKSRIDRWRNIEGRFELMDHRSLAGKSILLLDDVLTTGATLEACGQTLLEIPGISLYIASLAYTST